MVSCTSDKFIDKGVYRPHIPQNESFELAALEMVDFVLIDDNKKPLNLLNKLKPDFFAKGFGLPLRVCRKQLKEKNVIDRYGGKLIFTPECVYSSAILKL